MQNNASFFSITKAALALVIIITWGCGQRGSPSGGLKDVTPPFVKETTPDSLATNFNGKELTWKFDEYVSISGLAKEVLISPPIKNQPTFKLVGKKLIMKFDTSFNENTTYSIFLGKGVKDLNEGNPLENNLLVFSTGEEIDSLDFHGEIYDAESMVALKEGMVHLYKNSDDSIPAKELPSYFAKVSNGHFAFFNLAAGKYRLLALQDNNGNYLFDLPNEAIAFHSDLININNEPDSGEIVLRSFTAKNNKQFLSEKNCDFKGKISLKFNRPVKQFDADLLGSSFKKDWKVLDWNEKGDSVIIWSSAITEMDSITLLIDYDNNKDTLEFNLSNRKNINTQRLYIGHNFKGNFNSNKKELLLTGNQPISSYDTSKIFIMTENDTSNLSLCHSKNSLKKLKANIELSEAENYRIKIHPGAIKSIFDVINEDTIRLNFSTIENTSLGNLIAKYDFSSIQENGILQIFLEGKLIDEYIITDKKGAISLVGSKPGNYSFKYIVDENNDGEWTPGDYWTNTQPEKVYLYKDPINLRANWDLDVEWILIP